MVVTTVCAAADLRGCLAVTVPSALAQIWPTCARSLR